MDAKRQTKEEVSGEAKLKSINKAVAGKKWSRVVSEAKDLMHLGLWSHAEYFLQLVLKDDPKNLAAQKSLANYWLLDGRTADARVLAEASLALHPGDPGLLMLYGQACLPEGEIEEALAAFEMAEAKPGPSQMEAGRLFILSMAYLPDVTAQDLLEAGREWERKYAPPSPRPTGQPRKGDRIRLGYCSSDLREHSIVYFLPGILEAHDRSRFELFIYSDTTVTDECTERYKKIADHWREIQTLSEEKAATIMRADALDILVDLNGFFGGSRPGIFARRPAPRQVHFLGYNGTTGLSSLDYRITDSVCEPPGTEAFSSEHLLRLDPGFHCYSPLVDSLETNPPPSELSGSVTFGSFNNISKVNDEVIELWARVLRSVPDSRLLIKSINLKSRAGREKLRRRFAQQGIDATRIDILPGSPNQELHLRTFHRVDIMLDSFPVNGTTSTLEALWMGVPVVALRGDRHSARVSASLLLQLGLSDYVARDWDAYVCAAKRSAGLLAERKSLRKSLRERIKSLPLGDPSQFIVGYEALLQKVFDDEPPLFGKA